jgi:hypothetical protein
MEYNREMKKGLIIVIVFIALAVAGGIFLARDTSNGKNQTGNISTPVAVTAAPTTVTTPGSEDLTVSPSLAETANIIVTEPKANSTVSLPFTISGRARVFENQFNYQVLDANSKVLKSGSAYANSPDSGQFGNFSIEVSSLTAGSSGKLTVEVFDYSAKDGSKQDVVSIPVTLQTAQ